MGTYRVELKFTNPYIGSRNGGNRTLREGLSLREAQIQLLDMYNDYYGDDRGYAPNWGIAVINSRNNIDSASETCSDGTRSFEYDGRRFSIKEETEIEWKLYHSKK